MRRAHGTAVLCLALGLLLSSPVRHNPTTNPFSSSTLQGANVPSRARLIERYGQISLSFEANQGQADRRVKFLSRGNGYTLFLTPNEAVLALRKAVGRSQQTGARSLKTSAMHSIQEVGSLGGIPEALIPGLAIAASNFSSRAPRPQIPPPSVLRMRLDGANPQAKVVGLEELPGKSNYFLGNDPRKWRTNIPAYAKVKYADVYPGVDLVYYGNQRQLEYDFVVKPGSDPQRIMLHVGADGATPAQGEHGSPLRINAKGDLAVGTEGDEVIFHKPVVYQSAMDQGRQTREILEGKYVLSGRDRVSFEVARYDKTRPLVIDPTLAYSTYLGGTNLDLARGLAVDASGDVYVAGWTSSTDFPLANPLPAPNNMLHGTPTIAFGIQDAFVSKLRFSGSTLSLVYSTYLGSNDLALAKAIAVDPSGHAYVAGGTGDGFPLVNALPFSSGGFITKLNKAGDGIVYSTLFGGSTGATDIYAIAVDPAGHAYVTGDTNCTDFPSVNPLPAAYNPVRPMQDSLLHNYTAFAAKLRFEGSKLSLAYSTLLGGTGGDTGLGIAVDAARDAYVTGATSSGDFPILHPLPYQPSQAISSGFVSKLSFRDSRLNLIYSTYVGGSDFGGGAATIDVGTGVAVDPAGDAYVTGTTQAETFPYVHPLPADENSPSNIFVSKLHFSRSALNFVYFTTMEGAGEVEISPDVGFMPVAPSIAVDCSGNAYIAGSTAFANYPTVDPLPAPNDLLQGATDAFVRKLSFSGSTLSLTFSTFLGGGGDDAAAGIALDPRGNIYVAGITNSTDFPVAHALPAPNDALQGPEDAFVVKLHH